MTTNYYRNMRMLCQSCHTEIWDSYYTRCNNPRCDAPFYHNQCVGAIPSETGWLCTKCRLEYRRDHFAMPTQTPQAMYQEFAQSNRHFDTMLDSHEAGQSVSQLGPVHSDSHGNGSQQDPPNQSPGQNSVLKEKLQNLAQMFGILKLYDDLIEIVVSAAKDNGIELDESEVNGYTRVDSKKLFDAAKQISRFLVMKKRLERDEFLEAAKSMGNLPAEDLNVEPQGEPTSEQALSREIRKLFDDARVMARREGCPPARLIDHIDLIKKLMSQYCRIAEKIAINRSANT